MTVVVCIYLWKYIKCLFFLRTRNSVVLFGPLGGFNPFREEEARPIIDSIRQVAGLF